MTDDLFFDTDCLSAFLWINDTSILHELYGGKIVLPEPVYYELSNPSIPHIKQRADIMISNKDVYIKTIDTGTEEYKLYAELVRGEKGKKSIGRGEAGGIALAKTSLPVPVSPVINTVKGNDAACKIASRNSVMTGDIPKIN